MLNHRFHAPLGYRSTAPEQAAAGWMASHDTVPSPQHPERNEARRPRAMILDRDPAILDILGELLDDENYDVMLSTEFVAEDMVAVLAPDVIIADAALNRGDDGFRLYGQPIAHADGHTIPIVYSTTRPEVAHRLAERGIPILLKPFDLDALLALLGREDSLDT